MSDANRAHAALRDFIAELNAAWEAAGPPSFARLEKLSISVGSAEQVGGLRLRVLAASTTHEILRGKRRSLPEWGWVVSFVNVLRFAAAENGLNPDVVGTIADWKDRHQRARTIMRAAGPPPAAAPAPAADHDAGADLGPVGGPDSDPGSGAGSGPCRRGPPMDRAPPDPKGGGMVAAAGGTSGICPFHFGRGSRNDGQRERERERQGPAATRRPARRSERPGGGRGTRLRRRAHALAE